MSRILACPIVFDEPDRVVFPREWFEHIPFAFWIVDALRPGVFVELGTRAGNSYAAFAQAVQRLDLATACYAVDTWRGDPHTGFYDEAVFAEWSEYHDRRFSGFSRLVRSTFAESAEYFLDEGVDLLHIDGYHTFEAVSADFELWRSKMSHRGVVLLHDINVREREFGAWRFWEQIKEQYPSFAFLHGHGLGVVGMGSDLPEPVAWLLSRAPAHASDVATIRALFARLGGAIATRYGEPRARAEADETSAPPTAGEIEVEHLRDLHVQHQRARRLLDDTSRRLAGADRSELMGELTRAFLRIEQLEAAHGRAVSDLSASRQRADDVRRRLDDREEQFRARASDVERLNLEVSRLHDERSGRDEALARQAHEIDWLREQLVRVATDAGAAVAEERLRTCEQVARFEASPSWRVTAPLRGTARALRRLWRRASGNGTRERAVLEVLFDAAYYMERYPDVGTTGLDPVAHYLLTGWRQHRNPHPLFDAAFYLQRHPDVARSGMNPLVHYLTVGGREGRDPHPLFQSKYYLARNPDVAESGVNPLVHFVHFGGAEGRNPHPSFDSEFYLSRNPDVAAAHVNPLVHFVTRGAAEQRDPNGEFVTAFYVQENPDAGAPGGNPLAHYVQIGQPNGRRCRLPRR